MRKNIVKCMFWKELGCKNGIQFVIFTLLVNQTMYKLTTLNKAPKNEKISSHLIRGSGLQALVLRGIFVGEPT